MDSQAQALAPISRHEAGHFIVAMRQGHILDRVTIVAEGDRSGLAVSSAGPALGGDRKRMLMEQAVVYLAGPAAERRFVDALSPSCADNDGANARMQFGGVDHAEQDRLLTCAQHWADLLVERWRPDIETLAAALLERRTMSGDDVIELFGGRPVEDVDRPDLTC